MRKGVSTYIAAIFILFIFAAFMASMLMIIRGWSNLIRDIVEKQELATQRTKEFLVLRRAVVNDGEITLTLSNTGQLQVRLVKYYIRDLNTTLTAYGNLNEIIDIGETKQVLISNAIITQQHAYLVALISSRGSIFRYIAPYILPTQAQANVTYTVLYSPAVFSNYTVATLGFNSKLSSDITPSEIENKSGTILLGDIRSLLAPNDGNELALESQATGTYYRTRITVTERSGTDLVDYQVKVVLDGGWDGWNKTKLDGSDIYFTDSNGNPLYFWIQVFDVQNKQAIIWVKVPEIPARSSVTLYMYYGESHNPYANYRDPQKVFLFFDNMEKWVGWVQYGSGQVCQDNTRKYEGNYSAHKTTANDPNGAYKPIGTTLGRGICLEAYINRNSQYTGGSIDRIGLIDDNGNGYGFALNHNYLWIWAGVGVDKRTNYQPSIRYGSIVNDITDSWYKAVLKITDTRVIAELWYGGALQGTATLNDNSYNSFTRFYIFGGHDYWVDLVFIRKYIDPEPNATVDTPSEVLAQYSVSLAVFWTSVTPYSSIIYLNIIGSVNITSFNVEIYDNTSGMWELSHLGINELPSRILINRPLNGNTLGIILNISSLSPFTLSLDYTSINERIINFNEPLILVAVNGSSTLYLCNCIANNWSTKQLGGIIVNPCVAFDSITGTFYIVNYTTVINYDPFTKDINYLFNLDEAASSSGFVAVLYNGTRWLLYSPGGEGKSVYIYDLAKGGNSYYFYNLTESVREYTCVACDLNEDVLYIMFGGSGDILKVSVNADGTFWNKSISLVPSPPTVFPVGLAFGGGYLWVIGKGGGVHKINPVTGTVEALAIQLPYYPISEGDRLVYVNIAGTAYLYHIREDGTSEVWVIKIS